MANGKPKVEVVPPTPPIHDLFKPTQSQIPQFGYGHNIIVRKLHKWQLQDIADIRRIEAEIATSSKEYQAEQMEMFSAVALFMDKFVADKAEHTARAAKANHETEMMVLDKHLKLAELEKIQLENKVEKKALHEVLSED